MSDILIIGNGFDLKCGLKSSYKDYFEYKMKNEPSFKSIFDYISNAPLDGSFNNKTSGEFVVERNLDGICAWDIIFIYNYFNNDNPLWSDVESDILNFINENKSSNSLNKGELSFFENNADRMSLLSHYKDNIKHINALRCLREYNNKRRINVSSKEFMPFLLEELNKFEVKFDEYLVNAVKHEGWGWQYSTRTRIFLEQLIFTKRYYRIRRLLYNKRSKTVLISFNYTRPTLPKAMVGSISVHGRIGFGLIDENTKSDIIFGVDNTTTSASNANFIFTKTFRKLLLSNTLVSYLPKPLPQMNISFYGHSLSKADYSYFFSIFDYYSIYSNEVNLIFYYSLYGSKTKEEIIFEQSKSISILMSTYGATMDNKDHGENLLHKLELEGRIHLKLI